MWAEKWQLPFWNNKNFGKFDTPQTTFVFTTSGFYEILLGSFKFAFKTIRISPSYLMLPTHALD